MDEKGVGRFKTYWQQAAQELHRVKSLAGCGLLGAVGIVLKSMSIIITPTLRISFFFLPFALAGYWYGPVMAGMTGVVVDILGFLIRPSGPYFFGFTLNAFLSGMLYGLWLYKKPISLWRCLAACLTVALLVNMVLNPLWLSMLYGKAMVVLMAERVVSNAIQLPINTALLFGLLKIAQRYRSFSTAR